MSASAAPGEMACQVRAFDWSSSSIGPMERWPQALRSTIETMLASRFPMFVAWGPQGVFFYNDAYTPILGGRHPGALGAPVARLWSDAWDQVSPIFDEAFANRASYFEDMPVRLKRGGFDEQAYFTFSYSPVRGDTGEIEGVLCVCAETTATVQMRQRQARENEKLRLLFEGAPGFAVVLVGPNHVFEMRNAAYSDLIGGRDVLGKTVAAALPESVEQGFVKILDEVFLTQRPFVGSETLYISVDAKTGAPVERYVDFIFQPMVGADGESVGVFVQGHDLTEQALAKKALLSADRQKDQFIATLAHELRNPLAPISAAAHLLQSPSVTPATAERAAGVIGRQIGNMSRLLDDLLDVARIARDQMPLRLERCRADALIGLAIETARPAIEAKRHHLSIDLGGSAIQVDADRVRIVQVISNLLTNAAKYTEPGGHIAIESRRSGETWALSVKDDGIGIKPDLLGNVFKMFAQEQSPLQRPEGGLGIGLGLAKGLIELHGGAIEARSDGAGMGSVFTLRIPAVAEERAPRERFAQPAKQASDPSRSILLADDNEDLVDLVKASLEALGHRVTTAPDGALGLEAYRRERPGIAVLDIGMPKLNGYELARAIREEAEGSNVFLIAATGWGGDADKAEAKSAGFDAHLTKPFDLARLLELIQQAPLGEPEAAGRLG